MQVHVWGGKPIWLLGSAQLLVLLPPHHQQYHWADGWVMLGRMLEVRRRDHVRCLAFRLTAFPQSLQRLLPQVLCSPGLVSSLMQLDSPRDEWPCFRALMTTHPRR